VYRSDFAEGLSGFERLFHYYGNADLVRDTDTRGPSDDPSLRVTFAEKTKTMVGIRLSARPGQRLRLKMAGRADLQRVGNISVCVKCTESKGTRDTWIGLGWFPQGREFAGFVSQPFEVAPFASETWVFLFVTDAVGKLWIADVTVTAFEMPPEIEEGLTARGPTNWGVCSAFALGYPKQFDVTISDTCGKLMAAAGVTSARVSCWWGSRDQLRQDINQGRAWMMLDRRDDGYDFSELERRLDILAHYGLRAEPVVVQGTPEWASGKTADDLPEEAKKNWRARRRPFFPPRNWSDYEDFVFALVSRFKDRVRVWEVMNEPNIPDAGLQGGPRGYMEYLRRFYRVAKRADQRCTVLCGRVGVRWLEQMVKDDPQIVNHFDGLVSHPYTNRGTRSFANVRDLQLRMAAAGFMKPIHVTEVGFFGGKWKDPRPGNVVQSEVAQKVREGLPLMGNVSNYVTWWTCIFGTYAHGLLRDEGLSARPLDQYWAFGEVTGRLSKQGGPIQAEVEVPAQPLRVGQDADIHLTATNTSAKPQAVRFWPVGFVTSLGVVLESVRAHEWAGTLPPGGKRTTAFRIRPTARAAKRSFPLGLAIMCQDGNTLALTDITVQPALPKGTEE